MSTITLLHTALESNSTTTLCGKKRTKRNTVDYESFLNAPIAEQCSECYELAQAAAQLAAQEQEQEQESTQEQATQSSEQEQASAEQESMLPTVEEQEQKLLAAAERILAKLNTLADKQYSIVSKRASYSPANKSTVEKPVDIVWRECTSMLITGEFDENGVRLPYARKDVTARCLELGVNIHTIRTQTQACLKAGGVRPERKR